MIATYIYVDFAYMLMFFIASVFSVAGIAILIRKKRDDAPFTGTVLLIAAFLTFFLMGTYSGIQYPPSRIQPPAATK